MPSLLSLIWAPLVAAAVIAVGLATGCATPPQDDAESKAAFVEANDPLEPLNRYFFEVNFFIDNVLLEPVATAYAHVVPDPGRDIVRNFFDNLKSPVILANDVLQGDMDRASVTAGRFLANSTIGLAGLFDVATHFGWEKHEEDFGQTLGVWGVSEGPYLVLPIIGPSPPRDTVGMAVDYFFDPLSYYTRNTDRGWIPYARRGVRAVDFRAENLEAFDDIERTAIDLYATVRSLYRQRRNDDIRNGEPAPLVPVPRVTIDDNEGDGKGKLSLRSQ